MYPLGSTIVPRATSFPAVRIRTVESVALPRTSVNSRATTRRPCSPDWAGAGGAARRRVRTAGAAARTKYRVMSGNLRLRFGRWVRGLLVLLLVGVGPG